MATNDLSPAGRPGAGDPGRRGGPTRSNWAPVAGFVLVSSANQMLWLNFAPITTGSAHRLGVSSSDIGLLSEVFPLVYVLLAIPAGMALDRWFRGTLAVGALLTAVGATLRLGGHGFTPVFVGQVVIALGQPAVLNAVTGVATRSLTERDRPTGIAIGSAGTFLGFVLAFVFGLAFGASHLHTVLVTSAVYSIIGAAVLLPTLRWVDTSMPGRAFVSAAGSAAATGAGGLRAVRAAIRSVWADGVVRTVIALVFLGFGVFVALTTWVQTLLQPSGVGASSADAMLVTMVAAGIVSSVVIPPIVAKRRAQPASLGVAVIGSAVCCLLLAAAPGTATGYAALGVFGLVLLPALPILLELIERHTPDQASTATGLLWLSGNAGGIVVALLVQVLVHHPVPAWILMAVVTLAGVPVAGRLRFYLRAGQGVVPGP